MSRDRRVGTMSMGRWGRPVDTRTKDHYICDCSLVFIDTQLQFFQWKVRVNSQCRSKSTHCGTKQFEITEGVLFHLVLRYSRSASMGGAATSTAKTYLEHVKF